MKNKFTLIELIVSIVTLGILLAIILVNMNMSKKAAIRAAVNTNTSIIQTGVDIFYLKEPEGTHPTYNQQKPTLEQPVLVDIDLLVKKGYLKQDLDKSKIKYQYYWLDFFGQAWGATQKELKPVTIVSNDNKGQMTFIMPKDYSGYSIYKVVLGDKVASVKINDLIASEVKHLKTKSYRQIHEVQDEFSENVLITVELLDPNAYYLVSAFDQYSLETVPVGQIDNAFKPLIKKEGVFYYNVENNDLMYFLGYWDDIDTPGDSSISYRFATIEKKSGSYGEYVNSFEEVLNSLNKGYGIEVEITMKGDGKGNYPSIFDLHVLYSYGEKEKLSPIDFCKLYPSMCEVGPDNCTLYPQLCVTDPIEPINYCEVYPHLCIVKTCADLNNCPKPIEEICGSGRTVSGQKDGMIVLAIPLMLNEGEKLLNIPTPKDVKNAKFEKVDIEYSHNKSKFKKIEDISLIPAGSCVNILYFYIATEIIKTPPVILTCVEKGDCPKTCTELNNCPVIQECADLGTCPIKQTCEELNNCPKPQTCEELGNCPKPTPTCEELGNCPTAPTCEELNNCPKPPTCEELGNCPEPPTCEELGNCPEVVYTPVGSRTYYAHSAAGEVTTWESFRVETVIPEGTKILYEFSLGDGFSYSQNNELFPEGRTSKSIAGVAYYFVREDLVGKVDSPEVTRFVFKGSRGEVDSVSNANAPMLVNEGTPYSHITTQKVVPNAVGDFLYTATATAVTITGYKGTLKDIVVPAYIDGKPVTVIGEDAFFPSSKVITGGTGNADVRATSMIIPNTITYIGEYGMSGISATSMILPDSVVGLGQYSFRNTKSLKSIHLGSSVKTIASDAFRSSSIKEINIPASVTSISTGAFSSTYLATVYNYSSLDVSKHFIATTVIYNR